MDMTTTPAEFIEVFIFLLPAYFFLFETDVYDSMYFYFFAAVF